MRSPIPRVGGKKLLKERILRLFPKEYKIYCEPFCGGASVFFGKERHGKEILNDKDIEVFNMLKLFKTYPGQLISKAINGKYSESDFKRIQESKPRSFQQIAIKSLIVSKISFRSNMKSFDTRGRINSKYTDEYMNRLKGVTLSNQNYVRVISKYDSVDTFFYLDPPYENADNDYTHGVVDPRELFEILINIKGMFLLSYNDSPHIRDLFKHFNIRTVKTRYSSIEGSKLQKNELLISNY